jgi:curved DNA-binding protein
LVKYKDYYETLGVTRSSTEKEVKAAYRKLARQFHPDANPGDKSAEEKFKEISEAYEVLRDADKRKRYDQLGANWKNGADFTPPPGYGGGGFNFDFRNFRDLQDSPFSDFFDVLFGQHFGQGEGAGGGYSGGFGKPRKGQDSQAEIELTVEEVFKGTARNVHVQGPQQAKPRILQVKIPAGVRTGSKVRVPGEGGPSMGGGPNGDLFLIVKIKAHPIYSVEGENIVSELQISPARAVVGGEAAVATLDGPVTINVPPFSQNGKLLRLRERGLPRLKQATRGDHLVRLKIVIPNTVTPEEKSLYEQLSALEQERDRNKQQASAG